MIMLGLRMNTGLNLYEFAAEFGPKHAKTLRKKLETIYSDRNAHSYFLRNDSTVILTSRGLFVSDEIVSYLMFEE